VGRLKAHGRIVWGVSWAPDDSMFASCSRDQSVKLWAAPAGPQAPLPEQPLLVLPLFEAPVTAVAFAPAVGGRQLLGVGLEDGHVQVWEVRAGGQGAAPSCEALWRSSEWCRHAAAVRRLCWRVADAGAGLLQLASAGEDHAVRVARVGLQG
jgi:WD40 repeat protein